MRRKSLLADAGIGLVLTLAVAACYLHPNRVLETLELQTYDWRSHFRGDLNSSSEIVLVEIDDESIARLGRWPWPRTRVAQVLDILRGASPKVIGLYLPLSETAHGPGAEELQSLRRQYLQFVSAGRIQDSSARFEESLAAAAERLDADGALAAALGRTPGVVLPMGYADESEASGRPEEPPAQVARAALPPRSVSPESGGLPWPAAEKLSYPLARFLKEGVELGHARPKPDLDGVLRRDIPILRYGERYYPSFAARVVARYLGTATAEIKLGPGGRLEFGAAPVPLDEGRAMLVTFSGGAGTFRSHTAHQLLDGRIPADAFKDKIVLVGATARDAGAAYETPLSDGLPELEFVANSVENLLHRRFLSRPEWAKRAELAGLAFAGLLLIFVFPRLRLLTAFIFSSLAAAGLLGGGAYLFQARGEWLKVAYPACLIGAGFLIHYLRSRMHERAEDAVEEEMDKRIALAFHEQGLLDPAFERLRHCTTDDTVALSLYNLGLGYERERRLDQAEAVYRHIASNRPGYKDVAEKLVRLKKAPRPAAQAAPEPPASAPAPEAPAPELKKPPKGPLRRLGRYEIVQELGRGAMGVVYLGKDPKINRQVAIKTLQFDAEGEPAELKTLKDRFFREAESAGTLNHPNIVRIYDAGEEEGLCFIAMELLEGSDLSAFTRAPSLLAPELALDYVAVIADALDYAHSQGIVHRDIKPANLMLLKDGSLRVADFGIARITHSSRTATGTVLGTPSYMSPEQVKGKKVDGRSDLFSLGVVLFEFLTGRKPFESDEIGPLLYQIAFEAEPDPAALNPALPARAARALHKALRKEAAERFASGKEMAAELRGCAMSIREGGREPAGEPEKPGSGPEAAGPEDALEPPSASQREQPLPAPEPAAAAEPARELSAAAQEPLASEAPYAAPEAVLPATAEAPAEEKPEPISLTLSGQGLPQDTAPVLAPPRKESTFPTGARFAKGLKNGVQKGDIPAEGTDPEAIAQGPVQAPPPIDLVDPDEKK